MDSTHTQIHTHADIHNYMHIYTYMYMYTSYKPGRRHCPLEVWAPDTCQSGHAGPSRSLPLPPLPPSAPVSHPENYTKTEEREREREKKEKRMIVNEKEKEGRNT